LQLGSKEKTIKDIIYSFPRGWNINRKYWYSCELFVSQCKKNSWIE